MTATFPFSALVGCDDLATALLLSAVDPGMGGVLVRGEKGTAKSTAVRALAGLLPQVAVVEGCRFACDPSDPDPACPDGPHRADAAAVTRPARLVELPVGASEDRVAGSLDLQQALAHGQRAFEPGLLAAAHRGALYVDEVNLLGDHVVDLLLDAAAMGRATVEREGVSVSHAARFQLIGTMNPEEGELRPQLLDRFGLSAEVAASRDPGARAEVVRRRLAFDADPAGFAARFADDDAALATRLADARARVGAVELGERALQAIVAVCTAFDVDGLRADLVTAKAAAAHTAWRGAAGVSVDDVREAARLALPHRRRRGPFEAPGLDDAELDAVLDAFRDEPPEPPDGATGDGQASSDGSDDPGDGPGDAGGSPEEFVGSEGAQASDGDTPADGGDGVAPQGDSNRSPATNARGAEAEAGADTGSAEAGDAHDGAAGEPGDAGSEGGDAAATVTLPAGAPFAPVRLELATPGRGARGRRSPAEARHGASVGARPASAPGRAGAVRDVAVAATVRAAAPHQRARGHTGPGLALAADDVCEHVREGREGNLVVFAVDASGSMAARKRMTAVKGAAHSLLTDAYQRRDRVAVVAFRGATAEVAVPPTTSVDLAAARLEALPTGGRTPLAAGLERAGTLVATEAVRDPSRRALLVVLTDGRATRARDHHGGGSAAGDPVTDAMAAAGALAARGVAAIVVDTEDAPVRLGLATQLARALGATPVRLEQLAAGELAGVVRAATGAAGRRAA